MIDIALTFISDYLNREINTRLGRGENVESIKLKGISKESNPENAILLSLIHIEEDLTFKNQELLRRPNPDANQFQKVNPEIRMNLYLLATAFFKEKNYAEGLKQLSYLIAILQGKTHFEKSELTNVAAPLHKIIIEHYPISFEQNNALWQTMGLSIFPSVIYKVRIVEIFDNKSSDSVPEIRTIGLGFQSIDS